jgi:hypothetical protein
VTKLSIISATFNLLLSPAVTDVSIPIVETLIPCTAEQGCKITKYLVYSIASPVYEEPTFNKHLQRNPSLAADKTMIKNQQDL